MVGFLAGIAKQRRFGLFAPRSDGKAGALINLQWEIEPVVDPERHRLVFAFQYRNYENADSSRYLQVVNAGGLLST